MVNDSPFLEASRFSCFDQNISDVLSIPRCVPKSCKRFVNDLLMIINYLIISYIYKKKPKIRKFSV